MPLTPAHAAAAWPIVRLVPRLPISTVVIGALAPDFEYLVRLAPRGSFGHTPLGIALFCLPVSLVVGALFERLVRPALLLPAARVQPALLAAAGATLGAVSHVAWDGFTHRGGWGVVMMPGLAGSVGGVAWYQVLQHASTLVGG